MSTVRFCRPFASGSRPTPDPFDKFLDSRGFYRKYTARDSTNLFRVISEQLYDTQDHYKQVRKDCVNFMIKHRDQYELLVQGDFDQYICEMAKNETPGTIMELRAMGYLFKRNIKLYRPFELGVWYVKDPEYKKSALHVFHATYFDSVFKKSYMIDAAFCQSIVYEMIYKNLFKLPNIEYSVETMLHSDFNQKINTKFQENENGDANATQTVFESSLKSQLDRLENTLSTLNEPVQGHVRNIYFKTQQESQLSEKTMSSDRFVSSGKKFLFDGTVPFPYKVAKALDANIYRNVEYDSWNEARKVAKSKRDIYKVGVVCMVQLNETENGLFKCRIQSKGSNDDTCIVYIEKLGEKRTVPFSSLRSLNGIEHDAIQPRHCDLYVKPAAKKPSIEYVSCNETSNITDQDDVDDNFVFDYDAIFEISKSLDFESYINLSRFNLTSNEHQEIIAFPMIYTQTTNMSANNSTGTNNIGGAQNAKNRNQTPNQSQNMLTNENSQQIQMSKIEDETKQETQQTPNQSGGYQNSDALANQQHVPNYYQQPATPVYYCTTPDENEQNMYSSEMMMPPGVYTIPTYQTATMQPSIYTPIAGNHYPIHVGNWPGYNPPMNAQGFVLSGPPQYSMPAIPAPIFQLPFLSRDLLRSNGRINFNPNYAYAPGGESLPLNDKVSMRFYYNLGVEYFKLLQQVHGHGQLMAMIDGEPCVGGNNFDQQSSEIDSQQNQLVSEFQQLNFESSEMGLPLKPRNYNDSGYGRRGANVKYKRNENRPATGKHFQGSFVGPTSKPFSKNNPKYINNQSVSSYEKNQSYDDTPVKEASGKAYQQSHNSSKREQSNPENETQTGNNGFGSNVPPFPYYEPSEINAQYGPPGNAHPRMTPPNGRVSSVQSILPPYQQIHGAYWMPNSYQVQVQPHQQQSQSQSLNTSGASNPSQ